MPLKYGFSSPFAHSLIAAILTLYSESRIRLKKIRVSSPLIIEKANFISNSNNVHKKCSGNFAMLTQRAIYGNYLPDINSHTTLIQLLFSFDQDMRVEKTLIQTLASQLSSTLMQLLFSFDQDTRVEKTLIQTLVSQLSCPGLSEN